MSWVANPERLKNVLTSKEGSEYLIIGKMGKEFKGADLFACRYATAPRMGRINADSICVMRWVARRWGRMHLGAMRLDARRLAAHSLLIRISRENGANGRT